MSRERPIIFSGPMVRAILEGRKTETRRVIKPQPPTGTDHAVLQEGMVKGKPYLWISKAPLGRYRAFNPWFSCPYGEPGDRLWVRETWRVYSWPEGDPMTIQYQADGSIEPDRAIYDDPDVADSLVDRYESWVWRMCQQSYNECKDAGMGVVPEGADGSGEDEYLIFTPECPEIPTRWRPSIHMPKWIARIWPEVTARRVERLQDIGPDGLRAEGFPKLPGDTSSSWRQRFADYWDSLNARRGYPFAENNWVWVVTFKVAR